MSTRLYNLIGSFVILLCITIISLAILLRYTELSYETHNGGRSLQQATGTLAEVGKSLVISNNRIHINQDQNLDKEVRYEQTNAKNNVKTKKVRKNRKVGLL